MKTTGLIGGLLLMAAWPLLAQQELPTMTLEDALAIARQRNPQFQQSMVDVNLAGAGLRTRYGQFLPTLRASLGWSGNRRTTVTGTDDFGRSVELPTAVTFRSSSATQSVSGSMTLFDGLRNVRELRAARLDVTSADEGLRSTGVTVEAEVKRRFFEVVRRHRLIEVEEQLLASAREQLDANERLFRVGSTDQVDILGAQVEVASQEQQREQAHGEATKARLRVLEQLGVLDESLDFEPVGALPQIFDPDLLDAADLVARAMEVNPLVRRGDVQVSAARQRAGAARGQRLPTVTANGGYSRGLQEQEYGAFFELNPQNYGFNFSLNVSLPIFSGFQTFESVSRADGEVRRADEQLRLTRLQIEQQVRSAFIDVQSASEGLRIQQRSTALARRRLELAGEQFRLGSASMPFVTLQQITQQAANAERALVDAEYNFAVARVNLEEQVGERVVPVQ